MKVQRGSRDVVVLVNLGIRGTVVNATPRYLYPPGMSWFPL